MNKPRMFVPQKKLADFCRHWKVIEVAIFGSALREDFTPASDVDILVTFAPDAQVGLFELAQMQIELQGLFKRPVDVVEKASLRNPYRRRTILQTAQVIYAA